MERHRDKEGKDGRRQTGRGTNEGYKDRETGVKKRQMKKGREMSEKRQRQRNRYREIGRERDKEGRDRKAELLSELERRGQKHKDTERETHRDSDTNDSCHSCHALQLNRKDTQHPVLLKPGQLIDLCGRGLCPRRIIEAP